MDKTLVISDFDGCISGNGSVDLQAFKELLSEIERLNGRFSPCSGRPGPFVDFMGQIAGQLIDFSIAENGCLIGDFTGHHSPPIRLASEEEVRIVKKLKSQFETLQEKEDFSIEFGKVYSITLHYGRSFSGEKFLKFFEDLLPELLTQEEISKIAWALTSDSVDIFPRSSSKGRAIEEMLRLYSQRGITFDKIIYIGDSANDIEAAKFVKSIGGLVIAPNNVKNELRPYVDVVARWNFLWGIIDSLRTLQL